MDIQDAIQEMELFAQSRILYLVKEKQDKDSAFAIVQEFEDMFSNPENPILFQERFLEEDPLSKEPLTTVTFDEFIHELRDYVPARINFLMDNNRPEDALSLVNEFEEYFENNEPLISLPKL